MGDLIIIFGAWNGFKESAAKVAIGFFSSIKIFENTAFGHVTEVPTSISGICEGPGYASETNAWESWFFTWQV